MGSKIFNYSNKKNPIQWFFLIVFGGLTLLLLFFMIWADVGHAIILIPLILTLLPLLFVANKMFFVKIIITNDSVVYKSFFKSAIIKKERVQAVEILKKPRIGPLVYYSNNQKPVFNLGRHFLIIRSFYKPDSGSFLLFKPVKDDTYITAEYSEELLAELLSFSK